MKLLKNRSALFLLGALLTWVGYLFGYSQKSEAIKLQSTPAPQSLEAPASAGLEKVTRVIDGDTIEITGGIKVRYIGINTPETVAPRKAVECFGKAASDKNKELVLGKEVRLEKDVSETDKYGRLLRYVYVGDIFVNDTLVKDGYARSSTYPPDVKYQDMFLQSEKYARENNLGLWGECL